MASEPPRDTKKPDGPGPRQTPGQTHGLTHGHIHRETPGQIPALKLEVFSPPPEPKVPTFPYSPWVLNPTLQNLFAPTSALSYGPNVQMPIQKVYNINLPGPTGGHVEMDTIYEVVLPGKDPRFTSVTLGERLKIHEYIRQILIKMNDGEDISLDSCDGHRSLMSYIKFMELNPNYYSTIHKNPYRGLPYGMLLYRSCFPIKLDKVSRSTICAKNSIGMNIRLYSLTLAEFYSHYFRQHVYKKYDVWRELIYYEYVRENILKKKESPNFVLLYAFFLSHSQNIDFFCLKKSTLTQKDMISLEFKRFEQIHNLQRKTKGNDRSLIPTTDQTKAWGELPDEIDPNLQKYSGSVLIVITESPHHNLYQWASQIYETDGIVKKMISRGFHDDAVWLGILFQILSALHVMQLHYLYIRNMTIEDNIYIKDLQSDGNIIGYWKYIINGISYYIPNHGYLVMVDTNFKDIMPETVSMHIDSKSKRAYKISADKIYDDDEYTKEEIRKKIHQNYRNIINTNAFTKEYTQNNLFRPPSYVMNIIQNMMNDPEIDLGKVIETHFRRFLNNRIGTYLKKETEVPYIRDSVTNFKVGELLVHVVDADTYKWCMFGKNGPEEHTAVILTKENHDSEDIVENTVQKDNLRQFSPTEKVDQAFSGTDVKLGEDELLETYIINSKDY